MLAGEARRLAYLEALGIPVWVSRVPLPGAALSALAEDSREEPDAWDSAPEAAVTAIALPMAEPPASPPAMPVVPRQPLQVPSAPVAKAHPTETVPAARVAAASVEFPRFRFWLKRLSPQWHVVVSLSEDGELSAREHVLLADIEATLGVGGEEPRRFHEWPHANPAVPRDAQAAGEAMAFLLRKYQVDTQVLLLGNELQAFFAPLLGTRLVTAPTLSALLEQPLLKRKLWQQLAGSMT